MSHFLVRPDVGGFRTVESDQGVCPVAERL
jgi:hypothetical protein